jgi:hypothetical protein
VPFGRDAEVTFRAQNPEELQSLAWSTRTVSPTVTT